MATTVHERQGSGKARHIAGTVPDPLGGWECSVVVAVCEGDDVWFSGSVSRRTIQARYPHLTESFRFALHARAILGLPIPSLRLYGPAASSVHSAKRDKSTR